MHKENKTNSRKRVEGDPPPISIQLQNTTREFQIDLIGYYITIGEQKHAIEIGEGLANKELLKKLRNSDKKNIQRSNIIMGMRWNSSRMWIN